MSSALNELNGLFRKVFGQEDLVISPLSDAASVPGWDSLTHVELIRAIEEHFSIVFTFNEMMAFRNVGDILSCIEKHLKP